MTIAIGILAVDGIVIAADRQESFGYQKCETGKLCRSWKREPHSAMAVTGAGNGPYLESAFQRLADCFRGSVAESMPAFEEELAAACREHYESKVLPFSSYPEMERPDYDLMVGCNLKGHRRLWVTHKLALVQSHQHEAIGIGAATARAILNNLDFCLPLESAIKLAVYVVREAKNAIEGCGLNTDVCYITDNQHSWHVEKGKIDELESIFAEYHRQERISFHEFIGIAAPELEGLTDSCRSIGIGKSLLQQQLEIDSKKVAEARDRLKGLNLNLGQ